MVALRTFGLLAVTLLACEQGHGRLTGTWLEVADCKALGQTRRYEPFEMSLEHASVTEQLGRSLIRMSPSARLIDQGDQLVIALDIADDVRRDARLEGGTTLTLRGDGSGAADLSLGLLGRCVHMTQPLHAEGTITFFAYGWKPGARLTGEMRFDLVDRRSGAVVGQGFSGEFDFESLTSSPLTAFSPDEY